MRSAKWRLNSLGILCLHAASCSSATSSLSSLNSAIQVIMVGAYTAPDEAAGNGDPKFIEFTLNSVVLKSDDGDLAVFDDDPTDFRIISRESLIAEKDLTDQEALTYSGAEVTFAGGVTIGGRYEDDMTATIAAPTATYQTAITVEKAKTIKLLVKAKWRNIITRDDDAQTEEATAPSLEIVRTD